MISIIQFIIQIILNYLLCLTRCVVSRKEPYYDLNNLDRAPHMCQPVSVLINSQALK